MSLVVVVFYQQELSRTHVQGLVSAEEANDHSGFLFLEPWTGALHHMVVWLSGLTAL